MFQQSSQATASATKLDELRDRVLVQHRSYPVQGGTKLGFDVSTVGVDENLVGDIKEQAVVITFYDLGAGAVDVFGDNLADVMRVNDSVFNKS